MRYPFIYMGTQTGYLDVIQNGLFRVFEVNAEAPADSMPRISVYGNSGEAYLGIARCERGRIYLRRSLSRADMKGFPAEIKYAALSGEKRSAPVSEPEIATVWHRLSDGSLIADECGSKLIALPCEMRKKFPGTVTRIIDEKSYIVFRY